MTNFHLEFAYSWSPWLFLLLIPALLATLIPYFLTDKRYRNTRNRIVSMVLHLVIMTLAISILTGVTFAYDVGNPDNELLLLVDVSDTEENESEKRDELVDRLIGESAYDGFKVGVVTFGFDQVYAVPFTDDLDSVYDGYKDADLPNTTATDLAAALRYAGTLFEHPETAKIVVITDGKETDESAIDAIGSVASKNIRVDVVYLDAFFAEDAVQITDVQFPDYHVDVDDECAITVTVNSRTETSGSVIELSVNGETDPSLIQTVPLIAGQQSVVFRTRFQTEGLHEILVKVSEGTDHLDENNEYCAYYYLERYKKVLIIEQKEGQSQKLEELLKSDGYEPEVLNVTTGETLPSGDPFPTSVDDLCKYDQIILNNIANKDLENETGLEQLLYGFVYERGGGLFTVGGSDDDGTAHAYNRVDMNNPDSNHVFERMLPVQAIDYTPPIAVMVIIDVSGSMAGDGSGGQSPLEMAKHGAVSCLEALTERDFIGVMTLDSNYGDVLPLTPRTRESYIRQTILGISGTGGTVYSDAISRAGQKLAALRGVELRHIIVVSDGLPSANDEEFYMKETRDNYRNGITLSFVGIGFTEDSPPAEKMQELVDAGHGRLHLVATGDPETKLLDEMKDDLNVGKVEEINREPFHPQVADVLSPLLNGVSYSDIETEDGVATRALSATLGGFYGVKARGDVDLVLTGKNEVPLYAQWQYGKGKVGSFMSDLDGTWSQEFLTDSSSRQFLLNVISGLMPMQDIRPNEIEPTISGDNYIKDLSLDVTLAEGESVRATITDVRTGNTYSLNEASPPADDNPVYVTAPLTGAAENRYTWCTFVVMQPGCYMITIEKLGADGETVATYETYYSFAYSLEYDQTAERTDAADSLTLLAHRGDGQFIESEEELTRVFDTFVTALSRSFDPRWLFMGLAIGLFLLDIAARKFKFKWIHEIVRERKAKRAEEVARRQR